MRMVQVPVHEVVDVIPVGDPFVRTRRTVDVSLRMAAAIVRGRAGGRILGADLKHVIVHMIAVHMMEMSLVQIIDVITVLDRDMSAARPMRMGVPVVHLAVPLWHRSLPPWLCRVPIATCDPSCHDISSLTHPPRLQHTPLGELFKNAAAHGAAS